MVTTWWLRSGVVLARISVGPPVADGRTAIVTLGFATRARRAALSR